MHAKVKNLFQGLVVFFAVIAPLHLPNPNSVLNIMCALSCIGIGMMLNYKYFIFQKMFIFLVH
jgi:hypothetical protein